MTSPAPILRPTARALIIDSDDRVLLLHSYDARLDEPDIWFTPGGGLEDGEDYEQALAAFSMLLRNRRRMRWDCTYVMPGRTRPASMVSLACGA